jgi:MOSC domain-containing protein YiiM
LTQWLAINDRAETGMPRHLEMTELKDGLAEILKSPKNEGTIKGIVVRPDRGKRLDVTSRTISLEGGIEGDHWAKGCWKTTDDGRPDPDVQICIMNARCIALIAQERANWPPAGDNLFVDLDVSPENLPTGQRLALGSAIIEITDIPHLGCAKFVERYGRDACAFVNSRDGKRLRLRGVYARVVQDGLITVGDRIAKID